MTRPLVVRGGRVLDAPAHAAPPRDVLVQGGTILGVGPAGMAAPEGAAVLDAAGFLLIPGLLNAHTHSQNALAKALGDRWALEHLLVTGPAYTAERTFEEMRVSAQLAAAEMLLSGTTACYDLFNQAPLPTPEGFAEVGRAYDEIGIRAVVAAMMADTTLYAAVPGLMDSLSPGLRRDAEAIQAAPGGHLASFSRALLRDWKLDRERVAPALAPTIPLLCSDPFLRTARDLAGEYGALLHTHMAESRIWAVAGREVYGHSITAHFDSLGLLGPRFTAAHGVWLDGEEMARLADSGSNLAHNPASNLRLGSGLADTPSMREAGVRLCLGTDAGNCGDHLNMFENMRLAAYVSRVQGHPRERWIGTDEAFAMATVGSARAMGFEGRLGRIAPGHFADMVFLDLSTPSMVPMVDPTNQVVMCETGAAVTHVMVGGELVVKDRRLTRIDYADLARRAERAKERLEGAQMERRARAARLAEPVVTYCDGHVHRLTAGA